MAGEPSGSASSSSTQTSEPPPPDMGTLREAVAALYTSPDQDQRAAADRWLQWFLRGDHAWPLSIGMLRDATDLTSLEALFCARGLHVLLRRCVSKTEKTQKSHAVLSDDDWAGMRSCLLPMAWNFAVKTVLHDVRGAGSIPGEAPPRTVLTQVSLAIAALACKMPNWDERSVAADLVSYFSVDAEAAPDAVVRTVLSLGGGAGSSPGGGVNALSSEGAAAVTRAGAGCLLQILAVLPDEVTAKEISIHPSRRAAVADGLRAAAAATVHPTLDALARRLWAEPTSPSMGDDNNGRILLVEALASWCAFHPEASGVCPGSCLEAAVRCLCAPHGSYHPKLVDASVTGATAALVAAVHRPERRDALGACLTALRTAARPTRPIRDEYETASGQSRARIAEVLASVASRAAEPPPDDGPKAADPLGTGAAAAADRQYIPHRDFRKLQKERKRNKAKGIDEHGAVRVIELPLARADVEVMCFCLDALLEAMEGGGVTPAAALEPWSAVSEAWEMWKSKSQVPNGSTPVQRPGADGALIRCAAAAAAAASRCVRMPADANTTAADGHRDDYEYPNSDDDDDEFREERDELGEGLRDAAGAIDPDAFLPIAVAGLTGAIDAHARDGGAAASVKSVEGWTFVLFATARLTSKNPSASRSVAAAVAAVERLVTKVPVSNRTTELAVWTIGGLCKALSAVTDGSVLVAALGAVVTGLRSDDPSVGRGACVAAMRTCETCAVVLANGGCDNSAVTAIAECYAAGGPWAPPLATLRRGQEPMTTILCRGLASVAQARTPGSEAEAAASELAGPAINAFRNASATLTAAVNECAASPTHDALVRALQAVNALSRMTAECRVATGACVKAAAKSAGESPPSTDGSTTAAVLIHALIPAAAAALEALATCAPVFTAAGIGYGSNQPHPAVNKQIHGPDEAFDAVAGLLSDVVAAGWSSPATSQCLGPALQLALTGYAGDPMRCYPLLNVVIASLTTLPRIVSSLDADAAKAATAEHGLVARAALDAGLSAYEHTVRHHEDARVAMFKLAQACVRAGCGSLLNLTEKIAGLALESLRDGSSGEAALASLTFAADVLSAPAMLNPSRHVPADAGVRAGGGMGKVDPGMGRLASNLVRAAGGGGDLPNWASDAHEDAIRLADAFHVILCERGGGIALVRAMLECANGLMPPGLVTDVSAALYASWMSVGDARMGEWLHGALGGDKDGFPRDSTTKEQKEDFLGLLLFLHADASGHGDLGPARIGKTGEKHDLRRFKRCLKAFCGGKKSGSGQ